MSDISTQKQILNISQQLERLRKADAGIPSGTSFPVSPPTDMLFYRTDLDFQCFFDGTRWLTVAEYPYVILPFQTFSAASTFTDVLIRTDFAPYVTRVVTATAVTAPNSAVSNWLITIQGINTARAAGSTIETFDTSLDTAGVQTLRDNVPASSVPTNRTYLRCIGQKNGATGTPGNMTISHTIYTRLIVP